MRPVKKLTVLKGDHYAVHMDTPTGSQSLGKLNFDQVVAILENYFVFKNDSDFSKYNEAWKEIEAQIAKGETGGTVTLD